MQYLKIYNIDGGIDSFLSFLNELKENDEFKAELTYSPEFKTDDNEFNAELISITLSCVSIVLPIILQYLDKKKIKAGIHGKMTLNKNDTNIDIKFDNISIDELIKMFESSVNHS